MRFIERAGKSIRKGVDTALFIFNHDIPPSLAEITRISVVHDEMKIQNWIDEGFLTRERLQEIENDSELQDKYEDLMNQLDQGSFEEMKRIFKRIEFFPIDVQAGWKEYMRGYFEKKFDIQFLTDEEISP